MHKIALCIPNLTGGGAERSTIQIANGLARCGYSVDLLLLEKKGPYLRDVTQEVRLVDLGAKRARYAILPLVRYIGREQPDVIISNLLDSLVAISSVFSKHKAKIILSVRNNFSGEHQDAKFLSAKISRALAGFAFRRADAVVSVSHACAEDLFDIGLLGREKTRVIYNPVVSEHVVALQKETPAHEWLADKQMPVVLTAGRLEPAKDQASLIRAFALLPDKEIRLIILGEGGERQALESLARELGVEGRVSMPGFADNPYACMAHADLFVLASRYEGLPGVLIQALACGVTCVATNAPGGSAEILGDGAFGYLAPVGDPPALSAVMEKALNNPMPSELIRARAETFSEKASIDAYERLIKEVCAHD